jgi:hypothetical protein
LESISFIQQRYIICGNEKAPNTNETLDVAQSITITDATGMETFNILINTLTAPNLRTLACNFGLKNIGSRTKFEICLAMAEKKNHATLYNIDALAKSTSLINNTKNNIQVINSVFHPDYYNSFFCINNWKDCADFECRNGSNNNVFWSLIADFVNDASNKSLDTFLVIDDNEDYNKYINKAISPVQSVSSFAAYYFYMCCIEHPGKDNVLKCYLGETVKADTIITINDDNKSTLSYKKTGINGLDFGKLIDTVSGIGDKFDWHFEVEKNKYEDQRVWYNKQKIKKSSKEYLQLQLLIVKDPILACDPVLQHCMLMLKSVVYSKLVIHQMQQKSVPKNIVLVVCTLIPVLVMILVL